MNRRRRQNRVVPVKARAALYLGALTLTLLTCRAQELTPETLSPQAPNAAVSRSDAAKMPVLPLNEEILTLPGDRDRAVDLQVTFYKPSGPGPFPLAIINHGATKASDKNRGERQRFTMAAYYFLSRGYAVAMPMMRGFAGSGGSMLQLGCNLVTVAQSDGRDIRGVIEALQRRPDIDGRNVVVTGQSFGGWNTLGLGTNPPPGVRGLVLFNAALRSSGCPEKEQDKMLVAGAGRLGLGTVLPSLWFYGENDTIMPTTTWHGVFNAYKAAGTRARLVDVGTVGTDSHQFLSSPDNLPLWAPEIDAFLAGIDMPDKEVDPGYLPMAFPPPTHFAALTDAAAVPYLSDKGRALYARFLVAPKPRVFVVAPTGAATITVGVYDVLGKALQACSRVADGCHPYAINDEVVWTKPEPGEPTRVVSKAVTRDVSTKLGSFFAISKDCSLRGVPKVSVSGGPFHGEVAVTENEAHPAFPPGSPLSACNATAFRSMSVTYTPKPGFIGGDALTVDDVGPDGRHKLIRFMLRVT